MKFLFDLLPVILFFAAYKIGGANPDAAHALAAGWLGDGIAVSQAPILIATPDMDVPARPLLVNLRDTVPAGDFDRVLEVVPADAEARGPLRERWKHYQAQGFEVKKYDM